MQLCTFVPLSSPRTKRSELCTQELPFPEEVGAQPTITHRNAKLGGDGFWVVSSCLRRLRHRRRRRRQSFDAGDGFNGKHNILQVNIAQNRTHCTSSAWMQRRTVLFR